MLEKIKLDRNFSIISILLIGLSFIFDIYYHYFISVSFNYMGFKPDFNMFKYFEAKALLVFSLMLSYYVYRKSEFIYSIFVLLIVFFLLPNIVLFSFSDMSRRPVYSIVFLLLSTALISVREVHFININTTALTQFSLLFIFLVILLLPIAFTYGMHINFNMIFLKEIYEMRDLFSAKSNVIVDYFYHWAIKIVIPVFLVYCLVKKQYLFAIIAFGLLFYLFLISGNKIVYLTVAMLLFFYFLGKNYISKIKLFLILLIISFGLFYVIDNYLNSIVLRGTFVNRVFYFPALLNFCYFDYFRDNPLFFAENHFFNLFVENPYNTKVAFIISQVYFNTSEMYANNGIISDGFMNLGYAGVILNVLFFSFLFLFFNSIQINEKFFGLFFVYIFLFLSSPMLTMIITGGLWLLVLFSITGMLKK